MRTIYFALFIGGIYSIGIAQPFTLDQTFIPAFSFENYYFNWITGSVNGVFEEPDGRVVVFGNFRDDSYSNLAHGIRLMTDGSLDPLWDPPNAWSYTDQGVFSFGKANGRYLFVRIEGISSIGFGGQIPIYHLPIQDTFFCGGLDKPYFFEDRSFLTGMEGCNWQDSLGNWNRMYFAKVDSSGWIDFSFDHNTDDFVSTVDRYDSTKFLVFGRRVSAYDSIPVNKIFRIYEDGALDTSFYLDPSIEVGGRPLHIQEDGKVIIGGAWMRLAGRQDTTILLRINTNGSIDTSFNTQHGEILDNQTRTGIYSVCATTDGGLLIGGQFEQYDGFPRGNLVKTDADGFVDTRFLNGAGADSTNDFWGLPERVISVIQGQNDTYYVTGTFNTFDGQPVKPIIRLLGLSHTVGLEEELKPKHLKVFPNPASDYATFEWKLVELESAARIRIIDPTGRVIESESVNQLEGQWLWDTRGIARGLYLYEMRDEDGELLAQGKLSLE